MNAAHTFERVEKKYLLTKEQCADIRRGLKPHMARDVFGDYTIGNIYYDTPDYALIRASLEKPVYKEKLRLRAYGSPKADSGVFVEIKKKFDGVVYKRRADMSLLEAEDYLNRGLRPPQNGQIMREIDCFLGRYPLRPAMMIAYDRQAFRGAEDSELRLTFDTAIRYRTDGLSLMQGDWGALLLPESAVLMEIKIPGAAPLWLSRLLSETAAFPTSFSKYGGCYRALLARDTDVREVFLCA